MCVGGRFIGRLQGVSIVGNTTDSPKGLEAGIGKLQESRLSVSPPLLPPLPLFQHGFSS